MIGQAVAVWFAEAERARFDLLLQEVIQTGREQSAGETEVMTTRGLGNCIACHQVAELESFQFLGNVGPSLDGIGAVRSEAELRGIVANAKRTFPGSMMPAFYKTTGFVRPGDAFTGRAGAEPLPPLLTGQQIEDVVAFLMTLRQ